MSDDADGGLLHRDVVVVGGSAGGMDALKEVVAGLPAGLEAAVAVVLHTGGSSTQYLARSLSRAGPLPAGVVHHMQPLDGGHVYLPRADRHLLIGQGERALVVRGPRENRVRPAVDPLFRSAARWYGPGSSGWCCPARWTMAPTGPPPSPPPAARWWCRAQMTRSSTGCPMPPWPFLLTADAGRGQVRRRRVGAVDGRQRAAGEGGAAPPDGRRAAPAARRRGR